LTRLTSAAGAAPGLLASADVVALPVRPGDDPQIAGPVAAVEGFVGRALAGYLTQATATGRPGEVVAVATPDVPSLAEVLLVGIGAGGPSDLRRAAAAAARRVRGRRRLLSYLAAEAAAEAQRSFVEAFLIAGARYHPTPLPAAERPVARADLAGVPDDLVAVGTHTAAAAVLARDLAATPSNVKSPRWLATRARRVAASAGLRAGVKDQAALTAEGFAALTAVGAGSSRPPCLVELAYRAPGRRRARRHVVLVGKGITFDSGGLSLKPSDAMVPMKTDMSGAAAVIGAMSALASLSVAVDVTAVLALAENMPSGSAMRPGDVLRTYDGTTVEVLNTDAEGRLVLADALGYAVSRLRPDVVVDVATLTGAASVGLGKRHAALFSRSDGLAAALTRASEASGERVWRLPLVDDYRSALSSRVADLPNIATDATVGGGSITAALFLEHFVADTPWVHLDIAGPARADADADEVGKGATGFGTRLLLHWLAAGAPAR
jgi:leucyl aminopeptidase